MIYRDFGKTGLRVALSAWATNMCGQQMRNRFFLVRAAVDAGISGSR